MLACSSVPAVKVSLSAGCSRTFRTAADVVGTQMANMTNATIRFGMGGTPGAAPRMAAPAGSKARTIPTLRVRVAMSLEKVSIGSCVCARGKETETA